MTTITYSSKKNTITFSADIASADGILADLLAAGYDLQLREKPEEYVIPDGCFEVVPRDDSKIMGRAVTSFKNKAWFCEHPNGYRTMFSFGTPIVTVDPDGGIQAMHIKCIDVRIDQKTGNVRENATKEWSTTTKTHVAAFLDQPYKVARANCQWANFKEYAPEDYAA